MICPKDYRPCCDDLCRGGGCLRMGGYPMLVVCHKCKGFIDDENDQLSSCVCDEPDEE